MIGAGFHVYAVWDYCITKNRGGLIELNPKLLAFILAGGGEKAVAEVVRAIEFLTSPDGESRSKVADGRRLIKEGEYQYRMVNWNDYEGIKSLEDLREYNRVKQQEYRAKRKRELEVVLKGREAEEFEKARGDSWRRRKGAVKEAGIRAGAQQAIAENFRGAKGAS